jgi:hypothetical protein
MKNPARWVSDKDGYHDGKFRVSVHRSAWAGAKVTSATLSGYHNNAINLIHFYFYNHFIVS